MNGLVSSNVFLLWVVWGMNILLKGATYSEILLVKPRIKQIQLKTEHGQDLLNGNDNNRRLLVTDRNLQLNLELEVQHDDVTLLTCPGLKYRPEYCPIDEDVSIFVDGQVSENMHSCETYMSDDFKCVVTFTHEGAVEGLYLQDKNAFDFIVPNGCPECADVEMNPTIPSCGTLDDDRSSDRKLQLRRRQLPESELQAGAERDLTNYYEWLDRWDGCYPDMTTTTEIYMGIAVGSHLVTRVGGVENAVSFIETIVAETNAIYLAQLNLKLHVRTIVIAEVSGSYVWDNLNCDDSIYTQLDKFKTWVKHESEEGLWHIVDDCYVSTNPIGLAVPGAVCGEGNNVGITHHGRHLGKTWLTLAHEVGHNIGAGHTFQEGEGVTGGIMDYGDGLLDNEYQFNAKYNKDQICSTLTSMVDSTNCNGKINTNTVATAACGNGVIDSSEQCECPNGAQECECCLNCQLKSNAQCSPFNNVCCTDQCQYAGTTRMCETSDGSGYCRGGVCANADCASLGLGPFCGTKSGNPCRKKCSYGPYCIALQSNDEIRDGAVCRTELVPEGICTAGECEPVPGSISTPNPTTKTPTNFPTPNPTTKSPTNFPTPNPTTKSPTNFPTPNPTTKTPTSFPTPNPTTKSPTSFPTPNPTTKSPTNFPTPNPTTKPPTNFPTPNPTPELTTKGPSISFPTVAPSSGSISSLRKDELYAACVLTFASSVILTML